MVLIDAARPGSTKAGEFIHPGVKAFINRLAILPEGWERAHLPVHGFVNGGHRPIRSKPISSTTRMDPRWRWSGGHSNGSCLQPPSIAEPTRGWAGLQETSGGEQAGAGGSR